MEKVDLCTNRPVHDARSSSVAVRTAAAAKAAAVGHGHPAAADPGAAAAGGQAPAGSAPGHHYPPSSPTAHTAGAAGSHWQHTATSPDGTTHVAHHTQYVHSGCPNGTANVATYRQVRARVRGHACVGTRAASCALHWSGRPQQLQAQLPTHPRLDTHTHTHTHTAPPCRPAVRGQRAHAGGEHVPQPRVAGARTQELVPEQLQPCCVPALLPAHSARWVRGTHAHARVHARRARSPPSTSATRTTRCTASTGAAPHPATRATPSTRCCTTTDRWPLTVRCGGACMAALPRPPGRPLASALNYCIAIRQHTC